MSTETRAGPVSWACQDCLILLANGEDPPDMSGAEVAEWHAAIDRRTEGAEITLGMLASEHADDCPVRETGDPCGTECECESVSFSWSSCDVCGSQLGGERGAVSYWEPCVVDCIAE